MSKAGRKCRRWHYQRIEREFGEKPEDVIRDFFDMGAPLTVMAGILGISYPEMHEWVGELGLEREPIGRDNPHPVKERIRREFGLPAVQLICSERATGAKYREIREKYNVSHGFIASCLRKGAPWLIGDRMSPITVAPPEISNAERQRRSQRCREHNHCMKERGRGWFADMESIFESSRHEK